LHHTAWLCTPVEEDAFRPTSRQMADPLHEGIQAKDLNSAEN
jgi:hypothetical protein